MCGNIWICTIDKIEKYDLERKKWYHYDYPEGATQKTNRTSSPKIFKDYKNNIWCGYSNGLALLNTKKNVFEDFLLHGSKPIKNEVRTFCEDKFQNLCDPVEFYK